jgi:hypothetical protein
MKHATFDWNQIEDRIRPHVKAVRDLGYETTGSCGHDMWIILNIEPSLIPTLHADLRKAGYRDFEITYTVQDGFFLNKTARIDFGGDLRGDGRPFDLVLLRVDPESHPLYFVIRARRYPHDEGAEDGHDAYYYNEHTCPTNWTADILAVISKGDEDPHGFAEYVRRRAAPALMNENGGMNDVHEGPLWAALFPEITPLPSNTS